MNRTKRNIKPTSLPPSALSILEIVFRNLQLEPDRYSSLEDTIFFGRMKKRGKKEKRANVLDEERTHKYPSDEWSVTKRIESVGENGERGRGSSIPLKKSSHPGVISVYSGMTRRIPSTRKKPVSSAPSRIRLPLPSRFQCAWKKLRREKYRGGVLS